MSHPPLPRSLSTPLIPLLTHPLLASVLQPNHLPNLAALLQPFTHAFASAGAGGGGVLAARSINLQTISLPGFGLRVVDFGVWESQGGGAAGEDEVADALGAALGQASPGAGESRGAEGGSDGARDGAWETMGGLMDVTRPEVCWETFGHPLAMIIAIPSILSDPLVELSSLFSRSRAKERFAARPWQSDELLRFIVVVHDLGSPLGSVEGAQRTLESIKKTYGPHCSLLCLNSLPANLPPSPFLHETYASQPPTDPVRALLDPASSSSTVDRQRGGVLDQPVTLREDDDEVAGPLGEQGIESGRRLSDPADDDERALDGPAPIGGSSPTVDGQLLGGRLTEQDVLAIKVFLKEFAGGSLIPYAERTISAHNEVFNSTRKGITGRLFGAGRKLWGGGDSRPSSPGLGGIAYNAIRGFYPHQTPEATNRRLADLAFLLRDYKFAAGIYDGIRKDYVGDRASLYVAGASEMLGLSLLLSSATSPSAPLAAAASPLPLVESYFDSALATYVASPLPQLASVRMAIAFCELYSHGLAFRPASQALVRAAGEAEEVWAAVLLEKAAEVEGQVEKLGRGGTGRERRQAGNWVEAAKRFEVCGLKSYSTRCLEKALAIYRTSTWTQAQFFVEHALGRQAYTMGRSDVAVEHFIRLLALAEGQSGGWLDDFALAFQHLSTHHPEKVASLPTELPKALFDTKRTAIRTAHGDGSLGRSDPVWAALEHDFLRLGSFGGKRPTSLLREGGNVVSAEEPFDVVLVITNPLDTELKLGQLTVGGSWSDEPDPKLEVATIDELVLDAGETREILICIVPSAGVQHFAVTSVSFLFHNLFAVRQSLVRRGARLHATKAQRLTPTYADDKTLTVAVEPKRPVLVLETAELPAGMAQGETRRVALVLRNDGGAPAKAVKLLTGGNGIVRVLGTGCEAGPSQTSVYAATTSAPSSFALPNHLASTAPVELDLPAGEIGPGGQVALELLVHGPIPGLLDLLFFLVYQRDDSESYFASTAAHQVEVVPVLEVFANHRPSAARTGHHLITMEFTSLSPDPIDVTGVQMISAAWTATSPTGTTCLPTMTAVEDSQRSYLQLAPRSPPPSAAAAAMTDAADMRFTATKLYQLLSGTLNTTTVPSPIDVALTPCLADEVGAGDAGSTAAAAAAAIDLTSDLLQPVLLTQLSALRRTTLAGQYPLIPPASVEAIFPLLEPRDVVLVILYAVRSTGIQGHLVLSGLTPGPAESLFLGPLGHAQAGKAVVGRSLFEQTDKDKRALVESVLEGPLGREDDPVRVEVELGTVDGEDDDDDEVRWDFARGPCVLPVKYTLTNTSPRLSTRLSFSLLPAGPTSTLRTPPLPSGPRTLSHLTLPPLASGSLETTVVVPRPGVVDLEGSWTVEVETGGWWSVGGGGGGGGGTAGEVEAVRDGERGGDENKRWVGRRRFERKRQVGEGLGKLICVSLA